MSIAVTESGSKVRRPWRPSAAHFIVLAGILTFVLVVFFRSGGFGARLTPLEAMIAANAPEESVYAVAIGPDGTIYVATSVGLISGKGKSDWRRVPSVTAPVRAVAPAAGGTLYLAGETLGVSRYQDGRLQQLLPGNVSALALDPGNPSRLLAYVAGVGLHESRNGGQTWDRLSSLGDLQVLALTISPHDPNRVVAGSLEGRAAISADGGRTWEFPVGLRGTTSALAYDPKDPQKLWAAANGLLQASADGGFTWKALPRKAGDRIVVAVAATGESITAVTVEGYLYRHSD